MRLFQLERTNPRRKALRVIIPHLVERYSFLRYPQKPEDFATGELSFGSGMWDGIAVDELRMMDIGMLAATGDSTNTALAFMDDFVRVWIEAGFHFAPDLVRQTTFGSALVVRSEVDLSVINPAINALVRETFGVASAQVDETGMFGVGYYTNGVVEDPQILIERVRGVPLSEKQYWCQAPLTTTAHFEFLQNFERILSATSATAPEPQP